MKKLILVFFITLSITSVLAQEHDCEYFKTGQFRVADEKSGYEGMIERDENFQTEYTKGSNHISKYKITWIDDCNYELLLVESNNPATKGYEDMPFLISIVDVNGLDITIEIQIPGTDDIYPFVMSKIE